MTTDSSGPDPSPLLATEDNDSAHVITPDEGGEGEPFWATGAEVDDDGRPCGRHHRTTLARWYVLLSFCLLSSFQNLTFNTYSPIYPAVSDAYPSTWTPSFLDWAVNAANVAYVLCMYPASMVYTKWNVRRITLISASTVLAGAALRCVPLEDGPAQRSLTIASMIFNGVGASWMGFGGPVIAERWFPTEERTLATSLSTIVAPFAGTAMSFVVGPLFAGGNVPDETTARALVGGLFRAEAALCLLALVCCAVYFPDRPEHPPSEAAAAEVSAERRRKLRREETVALSTSSRGSAEDTERVRDNSTEEVEDDPGLRSGSNSALDEVSVPAGVGVYFGLSGSSSTSGGNERAIPPAGAITKYWATCLGLALPLGVSQGWGSVLYPILSPLGATEGQAATLGFAMTSAGCVGAIVVGAALSRCSGHLKGAAVSSMGVAFFSFLLFSADASGYLPFLSRDAAAGLAFASGAIAGGAFSASVPLYLELIVENSYGWADGGAGVMMTSLLSAVVQIAFTAALAVAGGGSTIWTSWTAAVSAAFGCLLLLGVKVEYRRLAVDRGTALAWTGGHFDREFGCY